MMRKNLLIIYIFAFLVIGILLIVKNESGYRKSETKMYSIEEKPTTFASATELTVSTAKTKKSTTAKTEKTTKTSTEMATEAPLFLDINRASYEELCGLSGIGDMLAQGIIDYREENGGFNNIEEIMNVYGIGENIFENIKSNIYVENPVYPDIEEEIEEDISEEENPQIEETVEYIEETEPPITLEEVAPIDINTADMELLMLLPHVDEEIAEKILQLRDDIHVFSHPYELLYVEELTNQQVAEIIEYIYVGEVD